MQQGGLIVLVTILSSVIVILIKICFASKCQKIKICWGLIKIDRDVEIEASEFGQKNKVDEEKEHNYYNNAFQNTKQMIVGDHNMAV